MSLNKKRLETGLGLIGILLFIGILVIPVVSAGTILQNQGNVMTSSTGKFIFKPTDSPKIVLPANPKLTFFFQVDTNNISSKPLPINENTAYACGNCGGDVNSMASQLLSKFWAPPSNYAEITKTTPVGNPFINAINFGYGSVFINHTPYNPN